MLAGALTGVFGELLYNKLTGRQTTAHQVEEAAMLGAVFGLAGGLGDYGTSAEASGGLGLNWIDDATASDEFDLAIGTLAAATANAAGL